MDQQADPNAPTAPSSEIPGLTNEEKAKYDAATSIQKTYRGHRTRRSLKGHTLSPGTRWVEAVKDAQFLAVTAPQPPSNPSSFSAKRDSTTTDPETGRATPARASHRIDPQNTSASTDHSPMMTTQLTEEPHPITNPGISPARAQWYRATKIARHAGADDPPSASSFDSSFSSESDLDDTTSPTPSNASTHRRSVTKEDRTTRNARRAAAQTERKRLAKVMDLQYFLEMVDHKHRYGSNLRKYHNYWKSQPTSQNFFYWLDHGEGRNIELPECPRERLQREQVRYLSREERLNYLVKVDGDGRFRWAKNGVRVTTDDDTYRDSVEGIVRRDDVAGAPMWENGDHKTMTSAAEKAENNSNNRRYGDFKVHSDEEEEHEQEQEQDHYADEFHKAKGLSKLRHFSPAVIFDQLLRAQIKRGNKWIFVVDTSFRLYIGIKSPGAFQHSSFLHGARISAAGLIRIKDGQLRTLSPLSGHYRPPAANFRSFVHCLRDEGVDMSHVSISKSYAVLLGVEGYTKTRKRIKKVEGDVKKEVGKLVHHHHQRRASAEQDGVGGKANKQNGIGPSAEKDTNNDKGGSGGGGHGHRHRRSVESLGRRLRRSLHLDRDDEVPASLRQQGAVIGGGGNDTTSTSTSITKKAATPPLPRSRSTSSSDPNPPAPQTNIPNDHVQTQTKSSEVATPEQQQQLQEQSRIPDPPPPARAPGGSGPEDGVPAPDGKR